VHASNERRQRVLRRQPASISPFAGRLRAGCDTLLIGKGWCCGPKQTVRRAWLAVSSSKLLSVESVARFARNVVVVDTLRGRPPGCCFMSFALRKQFFGVIAML
jgi:hypothetical protein